VEREAANFQCNQRFRCYSLCHLCRAGYGCIGAMPLRSLHFGPEGGGLVTFLVYPPDDLVLVAKIQWLGG
jgi:hypothetical protein